MNKLLLKVKMIKNKSNGQINVSIPKRQLDVDTKDKIKRCKNMLIRLEGFD